VGLTAYLFWTSDPRAVAGAAAIADWRPVGAAVLLVLADRALMAWRWVALLRAIEPLPRPAFRPLMRIFFVSTFVGTFLPASVGGDAVRSYGLTRLHVDAADAVASVVMDRLLGIASILLMALVGLLLVRTLASNPAIWAGLALAGSLCAAAMVLVFSPDGAGAAMRAAMGLPFHTVRDAASRLLSAIRKYASHSRELVLVLACSVLVQLLRVAQAYLLGRGLGIEAPATVYLAFVPLILLVMLLPVTFNGLGTSQAAFVWFFAQAGVQAPAAFALSLLFVALGMVGNLPGAALYALGRGDVASRVPS
jgi:uncharacterized protein (TIRG00374 family)